MTRLPSIWRVLRNFIITRFANQWPRGGAHYQNCKQDVHESPKPLRNSAPATCSCSTASRWSQKTEYNKSGRNAAVVKMKMKSLLSGSASEAVYKADEKFDVVVLDRKECTYSYFADPMYVFMDTEYNQYEVEADNMSDA